MASAREPLVALARLFRERQADLAPLLAREVGKPILEARGEVGRCALLCEYYAGEISRPFGDVIPAPVPGGLHFTVREPLGRVALITPWNFPLAIPIWKAAPALAFGNRVALKPAEQCPEVNHALEKLVRDAGFAEAQFSFHHGDGDVGRALVADDSIQAVSFTGSSAAGKAVATACAASGKKFQTEMGGKNVAIVLADADLDVAAKLVASGAMRFAGQKCTATSRVVVERPVHAAFREALIREIAALPVGEPLQESTAVGPMIDAESRDRVAAFLKTLPEPAYRGKAPESGNFLAPALYDNVDPASPLAQQELFAPVLAMTPVDSLDEALGVANSVPFGLSASLFTRDLGAALQYIPRIEAGMVRINADTTGVDPFAPFGGYKGSSSYTREQGQAAREFYSQVKTVQINP